MKKKTKKTYKQFFAFDIIVYELVPLNCRY